MWILEWPSKRVSVCARTQYFSTSVSLLSVGFGGSFPLLDTILRITSPFITHKWIVWKYYIPKSVHIHSDSGHRASNISRMAENPNISTFSIRFTIISIIFASIVLGIMGLLPHTIDHCRFRTSFNTKCCNYTGNTQYVIVWIGVWFASVCTCLQSQRTKKAGQQAIDAFLCTAISHWSSALKFKTNSISSFCLSTRCRKRQSLPISADFCPFPALAHFIG